MPGSNSESVQLLFHAAAIGDIHTIQSLIDQGVNINAKDEKGETALFRTVFHCEYKTLIYLLQQGCDPNIRNNEGDTVRRKLAFLQSKPLNHFQTEQYRLMEMTLSYHGAFW